MSPDVYLHFAAIFISYFVKVAVAYLLFRLLAELLGNPQQKFVLWLAFVLGSAGYWFYEVTASFFFMPAPPAAEDPAIASRIPKVLHEFLVPVRFEHPTVILGRVLVLAYCLGVLGLLLAGIWNRMRLHLLVREAAAPSGKLKHLFDEMCRHFGVRDCELLILSKVSSPATVYWWRPRVVLPRLCEQVDDTTLMADILYHELEHVARRDYFWASINDLVCRLLFFHPGIWQARKQMQIQREIACDLAVVAKRPEHRADYADTLTRVARLCLARRRRAIGIDFAAGPSLLTHRVRAILRDPEKRSWINKSWRTAAGVALSSAYGFLCSVLAVAVAFAPSRRPQTALELGASNRPPERLGLHRKLRRETVARSSDSSSITESPAFRMRTSDGSWVDGEGTVDNSESNVVNEFSDSKGSNWGRPGARTRSAGSTIQSIIVATVGSVLGADKDDRKRKDSSHVQRSTGGINLH